MILLYSNTMRHANVHNDIKLITLMTMTMTMLYIPTNNTVIYDPLQVKVILN